MRVALIGFGEVGEAVYEAWSEDNEFLIHDPAKDLYVFDAYNRPPKDIDLLLIAIGWSDDFINAVRFYQSVLQPTATIILSSVPVGTTSKIGRAVHSPVEGLHRNHMYRYLQEGTRWIGGSYQIGTVVEFFAQLRIDCRFLEEPEHTEFLKLRSTSIYGVNIELARWANVVCNKLGMAYDTVKEYDRNYNQLNVDMGKPYYQRYVLDAPVGRIGGHCVIPNAKILRGSEYGSPFIDYLAGFDEYLEKLEDNIDPAEMCPFEFKGSECGYKGEAVTCSKTLLCCTIFGNNSRFGGK